MGWATAIASLVGTALSVAGASESRSAMNKATDKEIANQAGYQKKGNSIMEQLLTKESPKAAEQNLQTGTTNAGQEYQHLQDLKPTTGALITPTSATVDTARGADTARSNAARAKLSGGYANMGLGSWLAKQDERDQMGLNNSFAANSARLLPLDLQKAEGAGSTLQGIGSLVSSVGSLAGMYGATQPNTAGTTAGQVGSATGEATEMGLNPSTGNPAPWYRMFPNLFKTFSTSKL